MWRGGITGERAGPGQWGPELARVQDSRLWAACSGAEGALGGEAGRSRGRGAALRGHWGQAVGVR